MSHTLVLLSAVEEKKTGISYISKAKDECIRGHSFSGLIVTLSCICIYLCICKKSQIFEANASATISLVEMGLLIFAGAGAGGFTEADCRAILLGLSFAESKVDWRAEAVKSI